MKKDNCTAMLVGKDASIDGSTMIARDEDGYGGINEKLFVVNKARHYDEDYVSKYNGFKMHLEVMAASGLLLQLLMIQMVVGMNKALMNITSLCLLPKLKLLMLAV